MVYQFPLPPLTLHTFVEGDSTKILKWIESLDNTTDATHNINVKPFQILWIRREAL